MGRALHKALLADRNRAWASWLADRLERPGTVLLAVGAGHLFGKDKVQDFLSGHGLEAERLAR
ncbi:MAG: TraB/GumN family protein [Erythrobacter sp.]